MALKHHCDRCDEIADTRTDAMQPPHGWRLLSIEAGDKSDSAARRAVTICGACDRDLTHWFDRSGRYELVVEERRDR